MHKKIDVIVDLLVHIRGGVGTWEKTEGLNCSITRAMKYISKYNSKKEIDGDSVSRCPSLFKYIKGKYKPECEWSWEGKKCGGEGILEVSRERFNNGANTWTCLRCFKELLGVEKEEKVEGNKGDECEWNCEGKVCKKGECIRVSIDQMRIGKENDPLACARCFNYLIKEHRLNLSTEKKMWSVKNDE